MLCNYGIFVSSRINVFIMFGLISLYANSAFAGRYWPDDTLVSWGLELNNGVAYISSPQFASHCNYERGQINMDGTEFNKAQYAYAMSAKARGKKLKYVVNSADTTCVITGLMK